MAEISLSLADLFEKAFGYKTRAFDPQFRPVTGETGSTPARNEQGPGGSPYYAKNALGMEYFMPVTLSYPDSGSDSGLPPGSPEGFSQAPFANLKRWNLPNSVVSISSKKTIIETPLTERGGTVKEMISMNNYEILIKGLMIAPTNEFPEEDMTTLRTIYEYNSAISIECALTDIFLLRPDRSGSDHVVITEMSLPEIRGTKNVRPYTLKLVSDAPFNLQTI